MARLDEKMKMNLIIKTYLLLNGKATASELAEFLITNFKWNGYISNRSIGTMLAHTNYKGHILYGLKKRQVKSTLHHGTVLEYYFEGESR